MSDSIPEPSQPAPSDAAVAFARLLIAKWPCIAYDISVPCSVPDSQMREFQARHIAPFLQGALARVTVDAGVRDGKKGAK